MIDYNLDKTSGILTLEPKSALTVNDFKSLTEEVDGYLANHDKLTGMMISIAHVPAWENFAALVQHVRLREITTSASPVLPRSPIIRF